MLIIVHLYRTLVVGNVIVFQLSPGPRGPIDMLRKCPKY